MGWAKYDEDIRDANDERESYPVFYSSEQDFIVSKSISTTQAVSTSENKTQNNHMFAIPPQINFSQMNNKKSKSAVLKQMRHLDHLANQHKQNRKSGGKIHYENRIQYKYRSVL